VIGPWHEDAELIEFPHDHYHFDFRFVSNLSSLMRPAEEWRFARVLTRAACAIMDGSEPRVEWMRRKCIRDGPLFPDAPHWGSKLERAYANKKLECGRCPHRGLPLHGQPVNGGVVVCPGHGLAWDVQTGALVPRAER